MSSRILVTVYVMAALILSAVSMTFEWVSPIDTPEGAWDWYREVGVRNGILVVAQHEPPGGGWRLDVDWPRFPPFPFFVGAGPGSGGLYIA
ncbi:MAG TPA: hypothetical protein VM686_18590, partial [Polyangiaceae bacterium]|nr:hypothetical protein [Polyangiaceae bacterium]